MKKLEELGTSPAPWSVKLCGWGKDRIDSIDDANGETIVETDCGVYPPKLPDARMLAAAPKMYAALWFQCFGETGTTNCRTCKGAELGNCPTCQLGSARAALAEASGEAKPVLYVPNSGGFLVRAAGEVVGKGEVPNAH